MTIYAGRLDSISGSVPNVTRIYDPFAETEGIVIGDIGSYGGVISDCVTRYIRTLTLETIPNHLIISSCKSSIDIAVDNSTIVGCQGNSLKITGNKNDVVGFQSFDCGQDGIYGIHLEGDYNIINGGSVRRSSSSEYHGTGVSCLYVAGSYNQVNNVELDGNVADDYNVVVSESSSGNKLFNLGVASGAGTTRYSVYEGTCVASETKEWGKGGLVELSTSVILRAWRDALVIYAYFDLGTAGSTDTEIDLLVNGSVVGSATITGYSTSGSVLLSREINPGDLLTVEVTLAGTDAADLSAQIGLV